MRRILLIFAFLFAAQSHALVLAKCTSENGKTLWASFGRLWRSGDTDFTYFPVELTVFSSPTQLQDRIIFNDYHESLKIPVIFTGRSLIMRFDSQGQNESLSVALYSDAAVNSFIGNWTTTKNGDQHFEKVGCTIY
jgi:hypothetical protein